MSLPWRGGCKPRLLGRDRAAERIRLSPHYRAVGRPHDIAADLHGRLEVHRSPAPAWKTIPTWAIYGTGDLNIPHQAMGFMAERAKAKKLVVLEGASHAIMVSNPGKVAAPISEAAR